MSYFARIILFISALGLSLNPSIHLFAFGFLPIFERRRVNNLASVLFTCEGHESESNKVMASAAKSISWHSFGRFTAPRIED
jgi:hypothetical protein